MIVGFDHVGRTAAGRTMISLGAPHPKVVRPVTSRATRAGTDQASHGAMATTHEAAIERVLASPAVGEGTDVRFETDRITGAALVRENRVVHAEAHRIDG